MPIPLRSDFDAIAVRSAARHSKDGAQARRLLAVAAIYEGASRTEAARLGGVTLQIIRDWVVKFNAAGPDGLVDRKALGPSSRLNTTHRAALVTAIETGPIPAVHGVVRWRIRGALPPSWIRSERRSRPAPNDTALGEARHATLCIIAVCRMQYVAALIELTDWGVTAF